MAAIHALAAKLKGEALEVLWNNAGVIGRNSATLGQIDADELRDTLMINTYAPILIAEAFTANVVASSQKKMAFTSSKLGSIELNGGGTLFLRRLQSRTEHGMQVTGW